MELEVPETCLWVIDAIKKGMDPEPVRCHPDGKVFCRPCVEKYHPLD